MTRAEYEQYIPILHMCDLDTICAGFDSTLLRRLYREFVSSRIPSNHDRIAIAKEVKEIADLIAGARDKLESIGVRSIADIHVTTADELVRKYDRDMLYNMYLVVCGYKPPATSGIKEYAETIYMHIYTWSRAEALMKGESV